MNKGGGTNRRGGKGGGERDVSVKEKKASVNLNIGKK
jgi:hypothetical protein